MAVSAQQVILASHAAATCAAAISLPSWDACNAHLLYSNCSIAQHADQGHYSVAVTSLSYLSLISLLMCGGKCIIPGRENILVKWYASTSTGAGLSDTVSTAGCQPCRQRLDVSFQTDLGLLGHNLIRDESTAASWSLYLPRKLHLSQRLTEGCPHKRACPSVRGPLRL